MEIGYVKYNITEIIHRQVKAARSQFIQAFCELRTT